MDWEKQIEKGDRFSFGKNWKSFLQSLDQKQIDIARESLKSMLGVSDLQNKKFLDVGCGSGLFSLCALQLGASVVSFDFDKESVECAKYLRDRFVNDDKERWEILEGSVLDEDFLKSLGQFDVVYSWGVLHHTGSMFRALENIINKVGPRCVLFISIYNDQGKASKRWLTVKRLYNMSPAPIKFIMLVWYIIRFTAIGTIKEIILLRPFKEWSDYKKNRGMSRIQNIRDWIGGLPFEVAKPEVIIFFFKRRGFELVNLVTCAGGIGCNEFVFIKK